MKIIPTAQTLKSGILDLSGETFDDLDLSGLKDIVEIILPATTKRVTVAGCTNLERLILPASVDEADISNCPNLKKGFVVKGLLKRLVLADLDKLRAELAAAS